MAINLNHRWLKRIVIVAVILLLLGFGFLEALRWFAQRQGVSEVDLPAGSEIEKLAVAADYVDAYKVAVETEAIPESLMVASFGKARQVAKTGREVVTEGSAPGLRFLVSYHSHLGSPPQVTFSTAVFYESIVGRVYFFFVRPVHRRIVPFMVCQTIK